MLLERRGLHALLAHLNGRTRHRYTGVYTFAPPMLRNVSLFDRENPGIVRGGDTPMAETYCSVVGADGQPFATGNSQHDPRLVAHPARSSVLAYCGVPLRDETGRCFGTLCHFDMRPRLIPAAEIPILAEVAIMVQPYALGLIEPHSRGERAARHPVAQRIEIRTHNESDQRQG